MPGMLLNFIVTKKDCLQAIMIKKFEGDFFMAKYKKKLENDIRCPLEYGLAVFGGKWKSRIICVLSARQKESRLFLFCKAYVSGQMFSIKKMVKMKWYNVKNVIITDKERICLSLQMIKEYVKDKYGVNVHYNEIKERTITNCTGLRK